MFRLCLYRQKCKPKRLSLILKDDEDGSLSNYRRMLPGSAELLHIGIQTPLATAGTEVPLLCNLEVN